MYLQVIQPPPPPKPGQKPAPVNPDALAATTAAETALQSQQSFTSLSGYRGMGACCSSCAQGGPCMGKGMGIFDSGMDVTGWGMPEWSIVGLTAWGVLSLFGSLGRGVKRTRTAVRKYRRRSARRAELKQELATL